MSHLLSYVYRADGIEQTDRLGKALARWLPEKITIGLSGTLGAGKTYLVQEICRHWKIDPEDVVSPTFTLCNEYQGSRKIFHLDLYRLKDEDDLFEVGATEYFLEQAVVFAEWSDRFPEFLPEDRLEIDLQIEADNIRNIYFRSNHPDLDVNKLNLLLQNS